MNNHQVRTTSPQLVFGAGILILGCLLFLGNLGYVQDHLIWKLLPLIPVGVGLSKIYLSHKRGEGLSTFGILLFAVGFLMLLHNFHLGEFDQLIGPMIVIGVGILVVTHALKRQRQVPEHLTLSDDFLSGSAILGGVERRLTTSDFKGGELTSIFGGFDADLSRAQLNGTARVDVFVLFGGAELKVPEDWNVSVNATAALGGIEDKTLHHPSGAAEAPARPRLVITGLVLFGGLSIKPR